MNNQYKEEYTDVLLGGNFLNSGVQLAIVNKENGIKSVKAKVEDSNYPSINFLNKLNFNCVSSDHGGKKFVLNL